MLRIAIPKGSLYENVMLLLRDAGIKVMGTERSYRLLTDSQDLELKVLRPQNIPKIVEIGSCDTGFTGYDWIVETGANVKELLDLKLDPVRVVVAIPNSLKEKPLKKEKIRVASEYKNITTSFLDKEGYTYIFIESFGATESFPPEDADMIIDNVSTGETLKQNNLSILQVILESSTRFIANPESIKDPHKKKKIDELVMSFKGVLNGRERVLLEMNVPKDKLNEIVKFLPCMRSPTVQPLYSGDYAVKVAVKKSEANRVISLAKEMGATDILEYEVRKVII